MEQTLLIIRGLPSAGKTDLAFTLNERGRFTHVEADDFFYEHDSAPYKFDAALLPQAYEACFEEATEELEKGNSVIVSNVFDTQAEIDRYQALAKLQDVKFVSLIVERRHESPDVHGVADEAIAKMAKGFPIKL